MNYLWIYVWVHQDATDVWWWGRHSGWADSESAAGTNSTGRDSYSQFKRNNHAQHCYCKILNIIQNMHNRHLVIHTWRWVLDVFFWVINLCPQHLSNNSELNLTIISPMNALWVSIWLVFYFHFLMSTVTCVMWRSIVSKINTTKYKHYSFYNFSFTKSFVPSWNRDMLHFTSWIQYHTYFNIIYVCFLFWGI